LLHCGVPVRFYYLPVWGFSYCLRNALCCITYHLQVGWTHKWPSVQRVKLQESIHCKYMTCHVRVTKSMNAATAGDHRSSCRHHLWVQLSLPLSLTPFYTSHSQWICKDRTGFWIRDGGRQVFVTAERSGSTTNAGCRA
jgi:hypothetical protein